MATKKRFSEYFGFTDCEVDRLYGVYLSETDEPEVSREDLRDWYDGYCTAKGQRLYNPRSIICSLEDNQVTKKY